MGLFLLVKLSENIQLYHTSFMLKSGFFAIHELIVQRVKVLNNTAL